MKKFGLVISIVVLLSLILTACQPEEVVKEVVKEVPVEVTVVKEIEGETVIQTEVVIVTATPEPVKETLQIFHWWTAPGEREAADAMFAAYAELCPEYTVTENPVPGGGGVSHRVVLQSKIIAGVPPDTFQTLGGAELKNYVDSKVLEPLDDFYAESKYADVIPAPLLAAVTIDGHPYSVPLNMHLENILYYNQKLFEELKITPPTKFDELIAACETLKAAKPEMACLGVGSKEKWEDAFVFDTMLLENGGPQYYVDLFKGNIDVTTDPIFKKSLEQLEQLLPYINTDHSGLTWDQAVKLVGDQQAAMTLMGTWAIGAFTKGSNWQPGVDFGAVTYPQVPERILLFHPDTYGMTVGAPDPNATACWLKTVASPDLQIPTDVTQGGLFARTDIDATNFPDPIRQELQNYVAANPGKLILDQHGSILPATAQVIYWDIISTFMSQPDVEKTIADTANMMTTYDVKNASAWYQWTP
jgi:glucose/mannose transport system substrate-binding protein